MVGINFLFLFVIGTGPGGLNPFYSCFFRVDLENVFLRSQTKLYVKKVAVKRCFRYIVAKACFYKTAKQILRQLEHPDFLLS